MLTQLRFKNWRSLRDVTIENLTPLTVLIGANSSGKTNIVDGLCFLRDANTTTLIQSVEGRGGLEKIHSLSSDLNDPIQLAFAYEVAANRPAISYELSLTPSAVVLQAAEIVKTGEDSAILMASNSDLVEIRGEGGLLLQFLPPRASWQKTVLSAYGLQTAYPQLNEIYAFITERWQQLSENFAPRATIAPLDISNDPTLIGRRAENLPAMLSFLHRYSPEIYNQLLSDLHELLGHLQEVIVLTNDRETRFYLEEKSQPGREAPTISAGTARIVAMLTAYYALDIGPRAAMPGLIVIEEPDTAMNPGLLQRFVDLLRGYVRNGNRQFILTTHNPSLLNYFQPEEVRVVSRDENGDTTVQPVPSHIRDIWLTDDAEYGLGEVWTTNVFGGLPK